MVVALAGWSRMCVLPHRVCVAPLSSSGGPHAEEGLGAEGAGPSAQQAEEEDEDELDPVKLQKTVGRKVIYAMAASLLWLFRMLLQAAWKPSIARQQCAPCFLPSNAAAAQEHEAQGHDPDAQGWHLRRQAQQGDTQARCQQGQRVETSTQEPRKEVNRHHPVLISSPGCKLCNENSSALS